MRHYKPEILQNLILESLRNQGFDIDRSGHILLTSSNSKDKVRNLHKACRVEKLKNHISFLKNYLPQLSAFFANGNDIDPLRFYPILIPVQSNTNYSHLFKLATLLWSIPVSQGFGRRIRFLVLDKYNNKLVGVFALGDPVFNLRVRDQWIGWNHKQRASKLYHVMDLFVLGAVPPYSNLLCGKLMAMLAASDIVRQIIFGRYLGTKTTIRREYKHSPHLAMITATSALGRSSIYNRIKYKNAPMYLPLGYTNGWGHFHLGNSTYGLMKKYLESQGHPIVKRNRFGQGPNWKMRMVRTCLEILGLSSDLLRHGIKREFYAAPLASNFKDFLLDNNEHLEFYDYEYAEIVEYFKDRWFYPRINRVPMIRNVKAEKTLEEFYKLI